MKRFKNMLFVTCGAAANKLALRQAVLLATLDMHLLRKCPCPLWLFKPHKNSEESLRLLAAIDPTTENPANLELTQVILELATSLREHQSGAVLDVLHAWRYEYEETLRNSPFLQIPEEQLVQEIENTEASHRAAFEAALEPHDLDRNFISTRFEKGRVNDIIPKVIQEGDIDILIMGTVARTGISGLLIGNTAESILNQVDCSVLAIKPRGFRTPVSL